MNYPKVKTLMMISDEVINFAPRFLELICNFICAKYFIYKRIFSDDFYSSCEHRRKMESLLDKCKGNFLSSDLRLYFNPLMPGGKTKFTHT